MFGDGNQTAKWHFPNISAGLLFGKLRYYVKFSYAKSPAKTREALFRQSVQVPNAKTARISYSTKQPLPYAITAKIFTQIPYTTMVKISSQPPCATMASL